jgi:hypothetical protein
MEDKSVEGIANAVKGIVEAVPVYQDAVQPAAKEVGKSLHTVAKTVNIALAPLRAVVWGFDQMEEFLQRRLTEKLSGVSPDRIQQPSISIAGPALEAMRFTADAPDLRELYASLLATAMNLDTSDSTHPAFVEMIKQMCPDEAKILRVLANGYYRPRLAIYATVESGSKKRLVSRNQTMLDEEAGVSSHHTSSYLDNLQRLGLIEMPEDVVIVKDGIYDALESHPFIRQMQDDIRQAGEEPQIERSLIRLTDLGRRFIYACVEPPPSNVETP